MSAFQKIHTRAGFTLVELIIGMTIFAMGMTAIFILLQSTMGHMVYSRNEIIVSNLLREELELAKNMRNSNVSLYAPWNKIPKDNDLIEWEEGIYLIENEFNNSEINFNSNGNIQSAPISIKKSTINIADVNNFTQAKLKEKFKASQLYLDDQKRYTHTQTNIGTIFASYLVVRPLEFTNNGTSVKIEKDGKSQGFIFDARVIVRSGGHYREYDARTLITDWIK